MAIQSRDPCQQGDASATVLSRQKTDEKPSGAFVDGGHEAVDPAVLPSQGTLRMLLAGRALAGVEELLGVLLCHTTLPPCGDSREGQGHCSQHMGEVILGQLLSRDWVIRCSRRRSPFSGQATSKSGSSWISSSSPRCNFTSGVQAARNSRSRARADSIGRGKLPTYALPWSVSAPSRTGSMRRESIAWAIIRPSART